LSVSFFKTHAPAPQKVAHRKKPLRKLRASAMASFYVQLFVGLVRVF